MIKLMMSARERARRLWRFQQRRGWKVAKAPEADNSNCWDATLYAARDFIRRRYEQERCVVGIGEVLDHLEEIFGEAAGLRRDVPAVLDLCEDLWADPHIIQVADGWIEFCWTDHDCLRRDVEGVQDLRDRLSRNGVAEESR